MSWNRISPELRTLVLEHLNREAERLEQDADRLSRASAALGRPSLTEDQLQAATAYREAIALLTNAGDGSG